MMGCYDLIVTEWSPSLEADTLGRSQTTLMTLCTRAVFSRNVSVVQASQSHQIQICARFRELLPWKVVIHFSSALL
jgi:hypothetical protein